MALLLVEPELPAHLIEHDDGFVYASPTITEAVYPERFDAPLSPSEAEGPPWATLVAGLESGRMGMRARFERALSDEVDRTWLRQVLDACYCDLHGRRGDGPGRDGFETWRHTLPEEFVGHRPLPPRQSHRGPLAELGCRLLGWGWETGHVPADHDACLYDFADYIPALAEARFEQRVLFDPDEVDPDEGDAIGYALRAFLGGRCYEAPARNLGDVVDVPSMAGLLNAVLRGLGDDHRLVPNDEDGEGLVLGTRVAIAAAWDAQRL